VTGNTTNNGNLPTAKGSPCPGTRVFRTAINHHERESSHLPRDGVNWEGIPLDRRPLRVTTCVPNQSLGCLSGRAQHSLLYPRLAPLDSVTKINISGSKGMKQYLRGQVHPGTFGEALLRSRKCEVCTYSVLTATSMCPMLSKHSPNRRLQSLTQL
jgi:hypothetical protein